MADETFLRYCKKVQDKKLKLAEQQTLTKREHFAMLILQSICSSALLCSEDERKNARNAVLQADALIDELNK